MNKQDRMKQKYEAEPDQWKRIWLGIQYICEYCSTEEKNNLEKVLREAAGYSEKAKA